jgi:hypothetical protein
VVTSEDIFGENTELDPESTVVLKEPLNGNVTIDENDGSITYNPNQGYQGVDAFTTQVCDTEGDCVALSFLVTVSKEDDGKKNNDALYAIIGLVLAPIICCFQEPMRRCYEVYFGKEDKVEDATTTVASTVIPTSISVKNRTLAQNNSIPAQNDDSTQARDEEEGVPDDEASAWDTDSSGGSLTTPAQNDNSTQARDEEEEGVPDDEASAWDTDSSGGSLTSQELKDDST